MKKVAILLPTYNERENIENFVELVLGQESKSPGWKFEIVIADSNSPDQTFAVAKTIAAKHSNVHPILVGKGLGVGLIEGHRYSIKQFKPDALLQMDADNQVEVDIIPRMLKTLEQGYDFVQGSRFVKGGRNMLSPSRRFFSWSMSWVCRLIMGPLDIKEFANSARAFTPELFNKIDLSRVPWQKQTFVVQPAFLNAVVEAGAKYKEIPLVFSNRAEGYSKNKILNYTYDVITYAIDARLHKWGINFDFFKFSHNLGTFIKFSIVGLSGTIVDFFFYKLFIILWHLAPGVSKIFSTELGIVNNFLFNNFWTFKHRQTSTNIYQKFAIYNGVSTGGLLIAVAVITILNYIYGNGAVHFGKFKLAYDTLYFIATIPPVMAWNFTVNHFVTWRHKKS